MIISSAKSTTLQETIQHPQEFTSNFNLPVSCFNNPHQAVFLNYWCIEQEHLVTQKLAHRVVLLPLTRANRVPNINRMQSFIVFIQLLLKFFNSDIMKLLLLFMYILLSSIYTWSDHVLFRNLAVGNLRKKLLYMCVWVYVGFTLVHSRVQQKAVMGRWIQGQTGGPVEVKTRHARGQGPEMWVT